MRYRALSASGDMTFGQGSQNYLVNSAQAVRQAIQTALLLFQGEWFLDTSAGMPWTQDVLGFNTGGLYDQAIRECILGVEGVTGITEYSSSLIGRNLNVNVTVTSLYASAISLGLVLPYTSYGGYGAGGWGENPYGT